MAIIRQYASFVRYVEVSENDLEAAAAIVNGLPISAEAVPAETATIVSDWEYIPDSDDFEDKDGNPICL